VTGNIIKLADLTKKYGSFTAVDHLNLSIRKGEIFGLLGPNGAGKSTTILMMLGLTEPTSGSAMVCDIDPTQNPIAVKRKVGYLPEDVGFYSNRSGVENLMFTAMLNDLSPAEALEKVTSTLNRVGLSEAGAKKTGQYSRGMLQRLGLADVLIKNPEVIILDEPTLGLDPNGIREFLDLIVRLSHEEGLTVLFSSHDLHQVQKVCDRVGLFVRGRLIAEGDIPSLSAKLFKKSPYIIEASVSFDNTKAEKGKVKNSAAEEHLIDDLKKLEGITGIEKDNGNFIIHCKSDRTAEVSGVIVSSGGALTYINKKEYGLDDIYYRYFEGGEDHE
jgi:ABC-2 type transport system ATP-binding protein